MAGPEIPPGAAQTERRDASARPPGITPRSAPAGAAAVSPQDGVLERAAYTDAGTTGGAEAAGQAPPAGTQHQAALVSGRGGAPIDARRRIALFMQLQQTHGNAYAARLAGLAGQVAQRSTPAGPAAAAPETADLAGQIEGRQGQGAPLEPGLRARLEPALGTDLGHVAVHTDAQADALSSSVAAEAFTTGNDIFFRSGRYDPDSASGLHLLAHEVTHTIQQNQGPVEGSAGPGGVAISDPGDRFEREAERRAGEAVSQVQRAPVQETAADGTPQVSPAPPPTAAQPPRLRRRAAGPVAVQRHPEGTAPPGDPEAINAELQNPPPLAAMQAAAATGAVPAPGAAAAGPAPDAGAGPAAPTAAAPAPASGEAPPASGPTAAPATAPATPESMSLSRAQEVLTQSYGGIKTIVQGSIVMLDGRPALWAKYDEITIGRTNPNTNAPWVAGDAQLYLPGLEGFADKDSGTVYVNKNSVLPTVTAHEMLHMNTASGFRSAVGETINEGMTEHLALKALQAAGISTTGVGGAEAYPVQRGLLDQLIGLVGEATLTQAYFGGAGSLVQAFEALQGEGTWAPFKAAMEGLNGPVVTALLTQPSTEQRIAAINALLDWWVSDNDLDVIAAVSRAPGTDMEAVRAAIQPRITSLTDLGQRTRLRVILGTV